MDTPETQRAASWIKYWRVSAAADARSSSRVFEAYKQRRR